MNTLKASKKQDLSELKKIASRSLRNGQPLGGAIMSAIKKTKNSKKSNKNKKTIDVV
jgi:hypothetical protein